MRAFAGLIPAGSRTVGAADRGAAGATSAGRYVFAAENHGPTVRLDAAGGMVE
jgi:hypothetical protein